jgi:hypothetical protein
MKEWRVAVKRVARNFAVHFFDERAQSNRARRSAIDKRHTKSERDEGNNNVNIA